MQPRGADLPVSRYDGTTPINTGVALTTFSDLLEKPVSLSPPPLSPELTLPTNVFLASSDATLIRDS
jgi:hypothetical protein